MLRVAAIATAALAVFAVFADTTRSPNATATSAAGAVDATVVDSMVSSERAIVTFKPGVILCIR